MNGIGRRVRRLEIGSRIALPWHLPMNRWPDRDLINFLAIEHPDVDENVTVERLLEIAAAGDRELKC